MSFGGHSGGKCAACRGRGAEKGERLCQWCTGALQRASADLRSKVMQVYPANDLARSADMLRWMVAMFPGDDEIGSLVGARIHNASFALQRAARSMLDAADYLEIREPSDKVET